MNLKGGLAYVDFKGNSIANIGSYVFENIYSVIDKAYKSRKILVIHNTTSGVNVIPDFIVTPVRRRDSTHYVFSIALANPNTSALTFRYIVVDTTDTVTISNASLS